MKSFYLIKPYFSENRRLIIIGLLCLIAVDILQLFIPRIIKWAVDDLTTFQIDKTSLLFYALYITGIAVMTSITASFITFKHSPLLILTKSKPAT